MKRQGLRIAIVGVGLAHVLVLLAFHLPLRLSNAIQLLPPLVAILLCLHEASHAPDPYFRRLWHQLSFSFLIWLSAQCWYFSYVLRGHTPAFPATSDYLWMLYAFPIFLVISNTQETTQDWVAWLDTGQACVSVAALYVLMLARPALISTGTAYDLQGYALLIASGLRYSTAVPGRERTFFRNLTIYLAVYSISSSLGYHSAEHGLPAGTLIDLAWTTPFVIFCLLTLHPGGKESVSKPSAHAVDGFHTRLHGIGAFALAVISIGTGGFLLVHRPAIGMMALTTGFVLFAARTNLRELQLHRAHAQLEISSLHDSLTGLANRKLLLQELARCMAEGRCHSRSTFAVLFVDLDRFKLINDSLGHAYGDRLLVEAAKIIRQAIGSEHILARLGGDEFAILLEGIQDDDAARDAAHRVIADLQMPVTLEGRVTYLNASIGIVLGTQGKTGDEMLRNADCAMYEAKAMGKGRARVFVPAMLTRANEELLVETDLRQALDEGTIVPWYQPIYAASGDRIQGFEALARWQHPVRGLVPPAIFIPIAEDTGLILELGKQVLRQACLQIRNWNSLYQSSLSVSVNISACQFADPNLIDDIQEIVRTTRVDPRFLKLEITESVLIAGLQSAKQVLEAARNCGIEIYLDDFGTGYSSLSYLLDFPFDVVKIDRSFIHNLEHDERRTEVVRMIIQLTTNLRKRVIAEGVETAGELERLRYLGCDLVQGYLLSKPLPAKVMSALLTESPASLRHDHPRTVGPTLLSATALFTPNLLTGTETTATPALMAGAILNEPLKIG